VLIVITNHFLFGQPVALKAIGCSCNGKPGSTFDKPYINLYVRITNVCQTNCPFCEFHGKDSIQFDLIKFERMLINLNKQVRINKVSFTGGEPSLNMERLERAIDIVKLNVNDADIVVNTNGYNLKGLDSIASKLSSISLSRHHYDDEKNAKLFGMVNSPTTNDNIRNIVNKRKFHISCNIVKGFIDNHDECYKLISFYSSMGLLDYGFVSLMKVNEFAKQHHVDFSTIDFTKMPDTINSRQYTFGDMCKCNNYCTIVNDGEVATIYARYAMKAGECPGMLVFDQNVLKIGFNGKVLHDYNN
jgi:molybdenum cofactor biosynthesis enzyme MoaA